MARTSGEHIENLIARIQNLFNDVSIIRYDVSWKRAIIDLEGYWKDYRIIVSEIHRSDQEMRYAYYVLDANGKVVHAFDNSPDNKAIKQKYGTDWKSYIREEVPHQHDAQDNLTLTPMPMTFEIFVKWIKENL